LIDTSGSEEFMLSVEKDMDRASYGA